MRAPGTFELYQGRKYKVYRGMGSHCRYGERQQRPLFPGRCQEAGTGRRRRPCGLQGQCGGHCFPAGRRYPFRYGLLWLPDDRGSQGKEQVRKNLRCMLFVRVIRMTSTSQRKLQTTVLTNRHFLYIMSFILHFCIPAPCVPEYY